MWFLRKSLVVCFWGWGGRELNEEKKTISLHSKNQNLSLSNESRIIRSSLYLSMLFGFFDCISYAIAKTTIIIIFVNNNHYLPNSNSNENEQILEFAYNKERKKNYFNAIQSMQQLEHLYGKHQTRIFDRILALSKLKVIYSRWWSS